MNLSEKPDLIDWPVTHYVFKENVGPFMETARPLWMAVHKEMAELLKHMKISSFASFYKMEPQMLYRAGVIVDKKPDILPPGFLYEKFAGGKYARFILTGSYANLPAASGKVHEMGKKIAQRKDFYIEHYVNDPKTTPEDKLITEILIPTAAG